jgi:arsenate reductase
MCPAWPGNPVTAHWGVPDPVKIEGDALARKNAFRAAYRRLESRVRLFMSLRFEELDRISLKRNLDEIGKKTD